MFVFTTQQTTNRDIELFTVLLRLNVDLLAQLSRWSEYETNRPFIPIQLSLI